MTEFLVTYEGTVRLAVLIGVLVAMAAFEALTPRRVRRESRLRRWARNLGMVLAGTVLLRLAAPLAAVSAAWFAAERSLGLFHWLTLPGWLAFVAGVVLLDLAIYWQHRLFHAVPALWRIHRMHHADLEIDVTSGVRFHPLEYLISMAIKAGVVLAIGAPVAAVIVFEVILNGMALFNHSNLALPGRLDRLLRAAVVTPDMHVIHHSVVGDEQNSNFGFNLSCWDRLFGTYRADARKGPASLALGIAHWRDPVALGFWRLLVMPFAGDSPATDDRRDEKEKAV